MPHLKDWPPDITANELAKDLCGRLSEYYKLLGTAKQVRFVLPGIDSTLYQSPSEGIAVAYHRGNVDFRFKLCRSMIALAGYREHLTSGKAIEQVLLAIWETDSLDALPVICATLAARDDLDGERYRIYATAMQVAQRFGPRDAAWEAVNALADARKTFPPKLIFDAFELCVADVRSGNEWWSWFSRHWVTMEEMSAEPRRAAAEAQMRRVARRVGELDAQRLRKGLLAIFGGDLKSQYQKRQPPMTPEGVLLHELTQCPDSKWRLDFQNTDLSIVHRSSDQLEIHRPHSHFSMLNEEAEEVEP